MIILILSLVFVLIDQVSKIVVLKYLGKYHSVSVIDGFFDLTLAKNTGAAFSFLEGGRVIFIVVALVVICFLVSYIIKNRCMFKVFDKVAISLILSGSVGNLIDRVIYGYVVDFLSFNIFGYDYPIFNFADCFIVVGGLMFLFKMVFGGEVK